MSTCGIYGIQCATNGKVLVGSSVNIPRRYSQHLWALRLGSHHNPHLQSAFNIYGEKAFKIEVLENCDKENLLSREDWWIVEKNVLDQNYGFNFKPAERPTHNTETCKKLSEGKIGLKNPMYGKHLTEEHKLKIRNALSGEKSYMFGKSPPENSKIKMSKSQTGKTLSEETKRRIGNAGRGRIVSAETRQKMSDLQQGGNWNSGRKASDETRRKMSEAHRGRSHNLSQEGRNNLIELHRGSNNPMFGKKPSPETIAKRRMTRLLNKNKSSEMT